MFKRFLATLLTVLVCTMVWAQQPSLEDLKRQLHIASTDSQRINLLNFLSSEQAISDPVSAVKTADDAIALSSLSGNQIWLAESYVSKAFVLTRQNNVDVSLSYYNKALIIFNEHKDNLGMANSRLGIGMVLVHQGNYQPAIEHLFYALNVFEKHNDKKNTGLCLINIGVINYKLNKVDKAREYYQKAYDLFEEIQYRNGLSICLNNLGQIEEKRKHYNVALDYYHRSIMIKRQLGNRKGIAAGWSNIGGVYLKLRQQERAQAAFNEAQTLFEEFQDPEGLGVVYAALGTIEAGKQNFLKAESYFHKELEMAERLHSFSLLLESYENLSQVNKDLNRLEIALKYHELYSQYKDSIFDVNSSRTLSELQTKYESQQKERENELLSIKLRNESQQKYYALLGVLLLLVLAFFIFRSNREKMRANRELAEKTGIIEEKNRIVEQQHKDITDSIRYARRIQEAILPPEQLWKSLLPESFVLYKPKDILSGDFYWIHDTEEYIFIAVADCTGHGVPGALMSIINYNLLGKAVTEHHQTSPGKILDEVNERLTQVLHQTYREASMRDGMDIALCALHKASKRLYYAGAYNPLFIISEGKFHKLAADKRPVGAFLDEHVQSFTTREYQLKKGDMVYLFTDGYADQFGGPKGKKFKYKSLQELLINNAPLPVEQQLTQIDQGFLDWKGSYDQLDDVLAVGFKV